MEEQCNTCVYYVGGFCIVRIRYCDKVPAWIRRSCDDFVKKKEPKQDAAMD
ncbi:MAG: hypothetical protein Q4B26_12140 [Eubacteriales bacterium]|nr:hypothetical protein [Eubacteriales bacterium]